MSHRNTFAVLVAAALIPGIAAGADITLPKGTSLELRTETPLTSATANKGDTFKARVRHALWVEGRLAVPAESLVEGEVKVVKSPRDGSKSAAMAIKFENLTVGGRIYDIEGVLTSLRQDDRKKILELFPKLSTGRKVDVILIGSGTDPTTKRVSTLVGLSGVDREDLAEEWGPSGLGPAVVDVPAGTLLRMELDAPVTIAAAAPVASRGPGDRNILLSEGTIKAVQEALRARKHYEGEATGQLDQPTRNALARFQIASGQPATGDPDEETIAALGVAIRK